MSQYEVLHCLQPVLGVSWRGRELEAVPLIFRVLLEANCPPWHCLCLLSADCCWCPSHCPSWPGKALPSTFEVLLWIIPLFYSYPVSSCTSSCHPLDNVLLFIFILSGPPVLASHYILDGFFISLANLMHEVCWHLVIVKLIKKMAELGNPTAYQLAIGFYFLKASQLPVGIIIIDDIPSEGCAVLLFSMFLKCSPALV